MRTPLYDRHLALNARIAPFGNWDMPIQYSGIIDEHLHTRQQAGLFDTCHMGEFHIEGPAALGDIERLVTCPLATLPVGRCRYGFLLNETGGVIDDCITYRLGEQEFYIVVNAGTTARDRAWITAHLSPATRFTDESERTGKLDLQGPRSREALQPLCDADLAPLKYFRFVKTRVLGVPALVSRTGYTGEYGFEIFLPVAHTARLWDELLKNPLVKPCGLGARDTLRLECALPLYGHELGEQRTPVASGMTFAINTDNCFIGAAAVWAELQHGPEEQLVGLKLDGRQSARAGQPVRQAVNGISADAPRDASGEITSGSFAPSLGYSIALAYVPAAWAAEGTALVVDTGRKALPAVVCPLPFYTQGTARK
ncbi:glycine cleavage system aminomethyltransferase GcvT [bacterium]|nr:glycine cleavage system aminomethyltransferase GcvT [bacterium]